MFHLLKCKSSDGKQRRPWAKPRYSDIYYARDLICLDYDLITSYWGLSVNAHAFYGMGWKSLREYLDKLCDESEQRKRSLDDRQKSRIIIFTVPLNNIRVLLKDMFNLDENCIQMSERDGINVCTEIDTGRINFRNWEMITGIKKSNAVEDGIPFLETMSNGISWFGCKSADKVRYSLAHMAEKMFYNPILGECRKERGDCYFDSLKHYEYCKAGSRSGALRNFGVEDVIKNVTWHIHTDIVSYDKKSAYPSAFVNDNKFPLGKSRMQCGGDKLRRLEECWDNQVWSKVVIIPDEPFKENSFMSNFRARKAKEYALEYWDMKSFDDMFTIDKLFAWLHEHNNDWYLITSEDTGFLPDCFRKRIMSLYNLKESLSKEDPERQRAKTMLESIYGKSIQRRDFRTKGAVNNYYFSNSKHFLMPQQGLHAVAQVKHELLWMINKSDSIISYDTDGVKIHGDDRQLIKVLNELTSWKNERAGYKNSTIGMWSEEYRAKRFVQFDTKVYAYETEEGFTWKLAGVPKKQIDAFIQSIYPQDPLDYLLKHGNTFSIPSEWIYQPETRTYKATYQPYRLSPFSFLYE